MMYDIEMRQQRISLSDKDLIKLVEERFSDFTNKYRIRKGVIEVYRRASGEIMFDWHESHDQSDELYQKVKKVYDTIEYMKKEWTN